MRPRSQPALRVSAVKMRDAANAAGVSIATVSNVVNHPHLVAARTRAHVQHIARWNWTFTLTHTAGVACVGCHQFQAP